MKKISIKTIALYHVDQYIRSKTNTLLSNTRKYIKLVVQEYGMTNFTYEKVGGVIT